MKELTEKQKAKAKAIAEAAGVTFILDAKVLRAERKLNSDKVKALDKILAIIAPPKAKAPVTDPDGHPAK